MAPRRGGGSSGGSSSSGIDYTPTLSIETSAGAVVFIVFYILVLPYYIQRARGNPTSVFITLASFCAIRLTGFAMRVAVDGSVGVTKLGLFIAWWAFYDVGIFALLYSVYALVLNREIMNGKVVKNPISRIISNKHLIRSALGVAVVIGIVAWVGYSQGVMAAWALQRVCVVIFLAVTAVLAIQTAIQVQGERTALGPETSCTTYIPCLIVILLLIRGIYVAFTTFRPGVFQTEAAWCLLAPMPELLAVFLFVVPGLVPRKKDLVSLAHQHEKGSG